MIVEGKGKIAPTPTVVWLTETELVSVRAYTRDLAKKTGWNIDNALVGAFGEGTFAKHLHSTIGLRYLAQTGCYFHYGDGGVDFEIYGVKIQMKTRRRGGYCQVKRTRKKSADVYSLIPLRCDILIFAELRTKIGAEIQQIHLLGWIRLDEFEQCGEGKRRDDGFYTRIDPKYLEPISKLVALLKVKQQESRQHGIN